MEGEIGIVIGPLENNSLYSVAKILERQGSEVLPFEKVKRRIKGVLREKKENELFAHFLEKLRVSYRDEVIFFDENIEALGRKFQAEGQD